MADIPLTVPIDRALVGRPVRLARERQQRDLQEGHKRGLWYDAKAAEKAIQFFRLLKHSKGDYANQHFQPEHWQAEDILRPLFGWKREDGTRRYREAYIELAKKNGKSFMGAGIGNYCLLADDEPGAEIYSAATKRDQAKIVWEEAKRMAKGLRVESARVRQRLKVFKHNLSVESTNSKFEPLGADSDSTDGLNIHGCIFDEVHAHKDGNLYDSLRTATASRRQPLFVNITTAGVSSSTSFAWQLREYGVKILEQVIEDDSFFVYIATLDDEDDWTDPACWIKANPNLGISVKPDGLLTEFKKALSVPARQNGFRRFRLNQWVEQLTRWLAMEDWRACGEAVNEEELLGQECFGGLDLANTTDVAALELIFPGQPQHKLLSHFWVPEDNIQKRVKNDRVPYDVWKQQGYLETTPGNVTDYSFIRARVNELGKKFRIRQIGFDPWNATHLANELTADGFEMVEIPQRISHLALPTKQLERLVLSKGIAHGNHPVLNWMASNVTVKADASGNIRPDKEKSSEKIDGISALIDALALLLRADPGGSVYEGRGILTL